MLIEKEGNVLTRNKLFDRMLDFNVRDKDNAIKVFRDITLNKTAQMFEYTGLPDSIPHEILELFLQSNGNVLWHEVNDTLYVFTGGLGGVPDVYYRPTIYTVANPALKYSKNVEIGTEGVLMRNDNAMKGLLPLIYKYGTLLTESDISFYNAIIATRDYNAFSAGDDATKQSAEEYQRQIEAGFTAVIAESQLLDGVRRHPTNATNNTLNDLKETYQYIKSLLYSDLGIKTAHNMKREYVSEEENIINDDSLIPLIDNMLWNRQKSLKEVNEMFGTNIEVKLRGTWELQHTELENAIEVAEGGPENEESEGDETTESNTGEQEETNETENNEEVNEETNETEDNQEDKSDVEIDLNINIESEETEDVDEERRPDKD